MAAEPPRHEPERRPEPVMMKPVEDNMDTAARVLALAQQTADQAIADARREADETLGRARREADDILTKARRQSEQITSDARARAESLERDAQERHRQAMGSLVQSREELERRVDDLRAFEREYRSRLKAYLEGQLRDLEAGAADSGVFPAISSGQQSVPSAVEPHGRTAVGVRFLRRRARARGPQRLRLPPDRHRPARPQVVAPHPPPRPAPWPPGWWGAAGVASLDSGACQ